MIVGESVSAFQKVCSCDLQLRRQKNHHVFQKKKHKISPTDSLHLYKPNPPLTQAPGHVARGTLASRVKTYIAPYLGEEVNGQKTMAAEMMTRRH